MQQRLSFSTDFQIELAHCAKASRADVVLSRAALWRRCRTPWQSSATCIYRNWLQYVIAKKAEVIAVRGQSPVPTVKVQRKGSAIL